MLIDLWDIRTLPEEPRSLLRQADNLLKEYEADEKRITAELPEHGPRIRRRNDFLAAKEDLEAYLADLISGYDIRCFHYSRMIDEEVEMLTKAGILLTSLDFLRQRLDRLVQFGHLSLDCANKIYDCSPLGGEEMCGKRNGMFWVSAWPIEVADCGVEMLLKYWGGESSYWNSSDDILQILTTIGRPRTIEISVPINASKGGYGIQIVAQKLVDFRSNELGLTDKSMGTDLYIECSLPPGAILAIHTEGDASFAQMAHGYPANFYPPAVVE